MKQYIFSFGKRVSCLLIAFIFSATLIIPQTASAAEVDYQNTIILINGDAVLVKLGPKGEILKKYINVPDYFTSGRNHESLVQRAVSRVKELSAVHRVYDTDHFMSQESIAQAEKCKLNKTLSNFEMQLDTNPLVESSIHHASPYVSMISDNNDVSKTPHYPRRKDAQLAIEELI